MRSFEPYLTSIPAELSVSSIYPAKDSISEQACDTRHACERMWLQVRIKVKKGSSRWHGGREREREVGRERGREGKGGRDGETHSVSVQT